MASILKVGGKWRALIRRKGHKPICKTHSTKAAAESWARRIEAQIDDGKPVAEERSTVGDLIDVYRRLRDEARPILDTSTEHYTLKQLKAGLGDKHVARLTQQDLVGYCTMRRDEDGAGPYTCNMDVSKLSGSSGPMSTTPSAWCWCAIARIRARRRATISGCRCSAKPGRC